MLLSPYDQKKLLERNTFLFIQIFFGFYLGATSGTEQLSLIHYFLPKAIIKTDCLPHFISLEQFNAIAKIFKTNEDLHQYKKLIHKVRNIQLSSNHQIAILAYLVIFDMDPPLFLNCIETLRKIQLENKLLFQSCIFISESNNFGFEEFTITLKNMSKFWTNIPEANQNVQKFDSQLFGLASSFNLFHTYSIEEESWLMTQFTLIEKAFRSVSVSEQMIQEIMMATLGIPLPKHHTPNMMAIFGERIWRVYRCPFNQHFF